MVSIRCHWMAGLYLMLVFMQKLLGDLIWEARPCPSNVRSHTILVCLLQYRPFPYTSASLAAPQALGTSPQDKNQEGVKASNSHSFVHALSSSSGSKLYTLLCSGFPLPIASAILKPIPTPLGPPLPPLAKLHHPYVNPYLQGKLPATKPYCEYSPLRFSPLT